MIQDGKKVPRDAVQGKFILSSLLQSFWNLLVLEPLCTLKNYWDPWRIFVYVGYTYQYLLLLIKTEIFKTYLSIYLK